MRSIGVSNKTIGCQIKPLINNCLAAASEKSILRHIKNSKEEKSTATKPENLEVELLFNPA